MTVIATETFPDLAFARQHGIELADFETLLARSDYLSLHCPHNAQTDRMFNRNVFAKMKRGSVLINTARGRLVVEADLLAALQEGHLAGAGLDVFEKEPATADNPLFALKNVVLSPHLAGADKLSQENMAIEAAECIVKLSRGQWPTGAVVNDELRARWKW
jgi:phosphoglycerate dehydrogenase-like enzyme